MFSGRWKENVSAVPHPRPIIHFSIESQKHPGILLVMGFMYANSKSSLDFSYLV